MRAQEGFRREEWAGSLEVPLAALGQSQARVAFAGAGWREVARQAERREAENPAGVQELTAKIGRERAVVRRAAGRTQELAAH